MTMVVEVRSSGNMWKVVVDGVTESQHRKKARAVEEARKVREGDAVRAQRSDGTFQDWGDL